MASARSVRLFTLLQRELQEYKLSLVWTPVIIAGVLVFLMLLGLFVGARFNALGDGVLNMVISQEMAVHPSVVINIDDEKLARVTHSDSGSASGNLSEPGYSPPDPQAQPLPDEAWNFSREWRFEPRTREKQGYETEVSGSLNPMVALPHMLLLVVLVIVTVNYLLGSLYNDRKDRSILFWKSMPVSEWEEVLTRFCVGLVVAPAIYIGVSLVLQVLLVALSMLVAWRMGADPWEGIWSNIQLFSLFSREVGGWIMTAIWIAPCYGWLLLASSWAKRTPSFAAVVPIVVLVLGEMILFGSGHIAAAIKQHLPHFIGGDGETELYFVTAYWSSVDWVSLVLGLLFAAATLFGAVYLRRYRFEI